jgi:hypothetical protein
MSIRRKNHLVLAQLSPNPKGPPMTTTTTQQLTLVLNNMRETRFASTS